MTRSTVWLECAKTNSLGPLNSPVTGSMQMPLGTGWLGPVGLISKLALQSSQL